MTLPSFKIKKQQRIYFGVAVVIGICLFGGIIISMDDDVFSSESMNKVEETNIDSVSQRINPQEVWVERLESENKLTQEKMKALEQLLQSNIKNSLEEKKKQEAVLKQIEESRHKKQKGMSLIGETIMPPQSGGLLPPPPVTPQQMNAPQGQQQFVAPQGVRKIVLKLSSRKLSGIRNKEKSTIENTIPAGTFAKATLLGGVDASTATTSQSDPRPVLLRVTDRGNLPRRFKSDLKACHVLASAYGDLSSERVFMRLEKLTCTERETGEISETEVSGYVLGEDGRAGVRGVVADRAGPMIRNSLLGGFMSGMSNFFGAQTQKSVFPVSPFGQTNALSAQQMLSGGASNGASSALDKYAEFFIKRAEQLQPVLQVAAGRSVDIVFTQGTEFGETTVRKSLTKIRETSRKQAVRDLESRPDQKNWLPSIGDKK
ncbi:MAG: TraB/VirB10 family protein [Alphaproteobacteria bacterium]|nr:TraB/VirB10 family protein [Alphaproteobacteria bacterium]